MALYEAVIGLEVHAQLRTRSKLFCSCSTAFGSAPNTNVCEVCSGMPGVLPVPNARAVEYAARMGMAVNCTVNPVSVFARKNYFYPDLPKGYQISQFETPICEHGHLNISVNGQTRRIGITRIHMEDDAGKNIHSAGDNASYVDLNRSGVPLIEIVSEPDMRSAEEAVAYLKALHAIVVYLGICDGNMEEGSFRCDANVSIRPRGQQEFGTRAELKNLNSFRNVQRAIEYEIARQQDVLEDGDAVVQETRLYDAVKNVTVSMRGKEEAHDYRYFPDPDLMPVRIAEDDLARWRADLPELPLARRARLMEQHGLSDQDADVLTADKALADFFEAATAACGQPKKVANLMQGALLRELNQRAVAVDAIAMRPEALGELVRIVEAGLISAKIANDIFGELVETGAMPEAFVKERGLVQISDTSAIETAVDEAIAENPAEVEAYKGGKTKLISFFMGQIMRKTKGKANPALVTELLQKKLG
ncbi:Asp-tRNA(Asn)/Glu-tRNA(Gln) amidotransferase subunit GatB [Nitratidesulfovibrio sp. SRB-5]|uniref:Asp-tRNA(Asn)/Glu-tRNA(Gln) amidotransferase subunit GatB n=1 Tax=Nitratidesulfovibrio sp. SRB-5 TaxID=2872636 RepID=UPI001026C495|nr:Asp-tRNA(Asn)/Glu-tRNA(Gln) amidotransferase subunit GatB [Nitratidesulfovibrio sp. SRB-5]MBZ2173099.1 Asp-tRNA(Asn)/Glu-tRNA(Gln) amidotransferase subunit GatB [Nitratidesulfovibrio sp. SRB-5]RXF77736.1 Asp-tRNA(Asn)/Glu-tRNA(Gln) amidotransferase subunit GatB [Desulfovibrio sp. DS-1]